MTVFFNHIYNDYLTPHNLLHHPYFDEPFIFFESIMTGLFVGMFLFFSGYGVFESVKKKGSSYIKQLPSRRLGSTLLNYDIAVLVFLVANLFLKVELTTGKVLLAFVGWESIGNSNWYIFAILCCYLISYLSLIISTSRRKAILVSFVMFWGYYIAMSYFKYPWWYNSIFCYPIGMLFSEYKERIYMLINQHYFLSLVSVLLIFVSTFAFSSNPVLYNFSAISFCLLCVLGSMKVSLNCKGLIWLGTHLFPLYIYQRLPMYVIGQCQPQFIDKYPLLFVLFCLIVTLTIGRFAPIFKISKK